MSHKQREDGEGIPSPKDLPRASYGNGAISLGGQIGPYKLIDVLGEGGFGIVYLAEQQRPVRRQVALKVIKPGMDTKQVIARFDAEQQALALLDHPSIAKVLDAGMTSAGRPYFVMENIKGIPITEYCDREKLSIEERLGLFAQVCDTIQHAHQKGIIHRDIKPSNILVTADELPVVIDFGIVKAISHCLTEKTLFTEQGQMIGTPEYMSPEQAEMTSLDIDTRSDIYSLGVLLYELLTGTLPFDTEMLRQAAVEEVRRVIREEEPPRPSTKLSSLGEKATKIAERRSTGVTVLRRRLRRELEWIPLKALRKERDHRYQTANDLGRDVRNYLAGNALVAGPESAVYRCRKFVRRNRSLVAGVTAVFLVLIAGITASTHFAVGQAKARAEADRQKDIVESMNKYLNNRLLAFTDPNQSRESPNAMLAAELAGLRGLHGSLQGEPLAEASIRNQLGTTFLRLGEPEAAKPHLERAWAIRRKELGPEHVLTVATAATLLGVYRSQTLDAETEEAVAEVKSVIAGALVKMDKVAAHGTARVFHELGMYEDAERFYIASLDKPARVVLPSPSVGDGNTYLPVSEVLSTEWSESKYETALGPLSSIALASVDGARVDLPELERRLGPSAYLSMLFDASVATTNVSLHRVLDGPIRARIKGDMAKLYTDWGKPDEARRCYREITLDVDGGITDPAVRRALLPSIFGNAEQRSK